MVSAALGAALTGTAGAAPTSGIRDAHAVVPLKASTLIIEFNSSAEDIGVQFFLDSEGWRFVQILDPDGATVFAASTAGRLTRQGGGTELFLESVEPELIDLPFGQFFARFPEGTYKFRAVDNDGNQQVGRAAFNHDIDLARAAGAALRLHLRSARDRRGREPDDHGRLLHDGIVKLQCRCR